MDSCVMTYGGRANVERVGLRREWRQVEAQSLVHLKVRAARRLLCGQWAAWYSLMLRLVLVLTGCKAEEQEGGDGGLRDGEQLGREPRRVHKEALGGQQRRQPRLQRRGEGHDAEHVGLAAVAHRRRVHDPRGVAAAPVEPVDAVRGQAVRAQVPHGLPNGGEELGVGCERVCVRSRRAARVDRG